MKPFLTPLAKKPAKDNQGSKQAPLAPDNLKRSKKKSIQIRRKAFSEEALRRAARKKIIRSATGSRKNRN